MFRNKKEQKEIRDIIYKEKYGDPGKEGDVYDSKLNNMSIKEARKLLRNTKKEDRY